jgi:hypothetical protein
VAVWSEPNGVHKKTALVTILWLSTMLAVSLRYFFIVPTSLLSLDLLVFIVPWALLTAAPSS